MKINLVFYVGVTPNPGQPGHLAVKLVVLALNQGKLNFSILFLKDV